MAIKRILAGQRSQAMREQRKTKQALARAAKVLGKNLVIRMTDIKATVRSGRKSTSSSRGGATKVKKSICA